MPHLGPTELIIILVIVLLIFGAGKLATLGGALGKGVRDFRSSMTPDEDEEDAEEPAPVAPKRKAQEATVDAERPEADEKVDHA